MRLRARELEEELAEYRRAENGVEVDSLEQFKWAAVKTRFDVRPAEAKILVYLVAHAPMPVRKEVLLTVAGADLDEVEPKTVDVWICRLRKKLADAGMPGAICTVWGTGFRIDAAWARILRDDLEAVAA